MTTMFDPFQLGNLTIKNRVVMAPMLMYTGQEDGKVNDLHLAHYSARALGGVGLITTEVVAVHPKGRISHTDLGLWQDEQIAGLQRLSSMIHTCGAACTLQLAHAGRKSQVSGSIYAPSAIAHADNYPTPEALTTEQVQDLVQDFKHAAQRATDTGFDCLEIHAAHGYLAHEFLSPLSNQRQDQYGGSLENRQRFLIEIVTAVRQVWAAPKPLIVRLSAEDRAGQGSATIEETLILAKKLKALGVDLLSISAGGLSPQFEGDIYPGYQVGMADRIKHEINIPVACNGSITSSDMVDAIVREEKSDLIYIGRALLRDPFWLLDAAKQANIDPPLVIPTYARATGPYIRGH